MRPYRLAFEHHYIIRLLTKRYFCYSPQFNSGHSRWATIRHDKGKNDAAKNKQRNVFAKEIELASKLYGPNPDENGQLAAAIVVAKKAGFPKTSISAAIARGRGISPTGAALENVHLEALLPQSVGVVIECQTDSRIRTLTELRQVVKKFEGNATPTQYLFEKKGRIIFDTRDGVSAETILEAAIDAGALDVTDGDEDTVRVFTSPSDVNLVSRGMGNQLGLEIKAANIIWDPNEDTTVPLDDGKAEELCSFIEALEEVQGVQAVYMNVAQGSLGNETWKTFQSTLEM
ncbi:YebC-like protein [Eremomyces bilateralis CBS 781.70]|uniref:YebC-like protein n=1 Tax=Eremomyces bilateralis CBS 781.70 TaxID=1392243 RepID=A0A6G1FX96_9PEZI|nr:YebC-like protein [Eremomyces bilateralis CBS 781.70]KAF1810300.1 YebC-like protein [Eremomyces bilateralis CBS 781.70]